MLSQADYQTAIQAIAPRLTNPNINWGSWYTQYAFYEGMWNSYFIRFLTLRPANVPITFVFWESCPGGVLFPHQNYAFHLGRGGNVIHGTYDSYLRRVCTTFEIPYEDRLIGDLINDLCTEGILIIDLYPSHGIMLENANRNHLFSTIAVDMSYTRVKLRTINALLPGGRVDDVRVSHELFNTRFDGGHPAFPAVDAGIRSDLRLGGGGYNVLAP